MADAVIEALHYTQAIYDHLKNNGHWSEPLGRPEVLETAKAIYTELINEEPVAKLQELTHEQQLTALLGEVRQIYQNREQTQNLLDALATKTREYAEAYGAKKA